MAVSEKLIVAGLTINKEKSRFCKTELKYLGYVVDRSGLHVDPEKVKAIVHIPDPKNGSCFVVS